MRKILDTTIDIGVANDVTAMEIARSRISFKHHILREFKGEYAKILNKSMGNYKMWYALYTKKAKEDFVALRLQKIGIEVLNPKVRSKKYIKNRLIEVVEAIFPCYLFARFDRERYTHLITYTTGVRYIVGKDNPLVVHDEIISAIKERMGRDSIIIREPEKFVQGDRVRIMYGPLKDFYGIFQREIKGSERVMILLEALQCNVQLDSRLLAGTMKKE